MQITYRHFFQKYRWDYLWGVAFLLATNALAAWIPLLILQVVQALERRQPQVSTGLLVEIAAVVGGMFLARVLSRYFLIGVGRKIEFEIKTKLYRHLLTLPRSFYDVRQTGDLMSRLTNDLVSLRLFLGGGVMLGLNVVFAYLTILPAMALLSSKLTLFAFIVYPPVIFWMRHLSGRVKALSHAVQDRLGDLTAVAQENFSGIGVIQSYAKEVEESARFHDASTGYFHANSALVRVRATLFIVIAMMSGLSVLAVLGEGGREVILGELGLSGFTAFMLYLERLSWPTISLGWVLSGFQQGRTATERINALFAETPHVTDALANPALTHVPAGPLRVQNLCFRYDNPYQPPTEGASQAVAPWVLRDVSFTLEPGALVAVVGPIGAGKTTLLNLLVRLYNPPEKTVFIGDEPVERYPLEVLRRDITLMPQNPYLFSDTVRANLGYGVPEVSSAHLTDMAQLAQLHDEVMALPHAYETRVGERGVTLSGGQRQRATLTRTLLLEPRILLLDDPFASVDTQTEAAIIEALTARRLLANRTTIFATQRFEWVKQADTVLLLGPDGTLEAQGTHEALLRTSERYRALNKMARAEEAAVSP